MVTPVSKSFVALKLKEICDVGPTLVFFIDDVAKNCNFLYILSRFLLSRRFADFLDIFAKKCIN